MRGPNGLARAAVRFKPSAFVGTFVALFMAALVVSACGILLETGVRASVPAERYAGAPVVAAADQRAHHTTGSGENRSTASVPLPDKARLDASLASRAAQAPGAAAAIPDVSFPVHDVRTGNTPATGHGWGSTAFTGTKLSSGTAPRTGEVVTGDGAAVGDRVALDTPSGKRQFTVSGTTKTPGTVWFTDTQAMALSGHPGQADAIAVLARPGVAASALADQVAQRLGDAAEVRTGDGRGAVETPGLAYAKEMLTALGGSFGGTATMVAVFTAAGTVTLSVGQRRREYALLRAIGATPRQIRRTIATEALLVAPLAGALGCLPGMALATWWFGQLRDKGAVPAAVELSVSWIPMVCAVGATVLTSLFAGYMAARRPSRTKPGEALRDASVERLRVGWIRTPLGVAALGGGIAMSGVAANEKGSNAANAALGVVMLFMLAVALLGPLIARACAGLFGLPLRAAGAPASLAAANSRTNARRLASAITPIVLAMAFASTLVFMHTSEDRVTEKQQRAGLVADRVITGPSGLASDAVARAQATPGVDTAVALTRTSVLVREHGALQSVSTQGFTGTGADLARVQDLGVRKGSLDALKPGTVALDKTLADDTGAHVGERLKVVLPDGTTASPQVVATYDRGLGLAQVTLAQADLARHTTTVALPTELLVKGPVEASALAPLGTVTDATGYATAKNMDRELNAWANTTMAAVLGGFAAIAAANTLVMTVLDRRRELGMLRLIGTTRRQVMGMVRWEALLVTSAGILLGTAIAIATLIPLTNGMTGENPYIPPFLYGSFAAAVLGLGLASTALPARAALR
ncbi:ABC transporter permease [Streptomyces sp. CBMA152]|uniref:ABC transporter permease n=1 Tax=Streptomyces sp. CBMA152 TaxID=1896312 RepID=UPI0016604685|nr:ABC transporter permease [Streptomyces sp. CBMA152]MBD0747318.1 ABC transporter permease [Streptomyces sp. CBMA152]